MSESTSKINLKIGQIEISIEGPSEFVSKQYDKVEAHLKTYSELSTAIPTDNNHSNNGSQDNTNQNQSSDSSSKLAETFGEWLNIIPKETSDTDKALLGGYYSQIKSPQKTFRVRDVSKLLKEHSIKLSNPSQFIRTCVDQKKLFQHSKSGNESNYKLTRETEETVIKWLTKK